MLFFFLNSFFRRDDSSKLGPATSSVSWYAIGHLLKKVNQPGIWVPAKVWDWPGTSEKCWLPWRVPSLGLPKDSIGVAYNSAVGVKWMQDWSLKKLCTVSVFSILCSFFFWRHCICCMQVLKSVCNPWVIVKEGIWAIIIYACTTEKNAFICECQKWHWWLYVESLVCRGREYSCVCFCVIVKGSGHVNLYLKGFYPFVCRGIFALWKRADLIKCI